MTSPSKTAIARVRRQGLPRELTLVRVGAARCWVAGTLVFEAQLNPQTINDTLGTLLKYQDGMAKIQGSEATRILAEVKVERAAAG